MAENQTTTHPAEDVEKGQDVFFRDGSTITTTIVEKVIREKKDGVRVATGNLDLCLGRNGHWKQLANVPYDADLSKPRTWSLAKPGAPAPAIKEEDAGK